MMKDQYNKLFWGIILATFHINLGMIRILPEFIGWWMVSSACYELYDISKNTKFMKARKVSGAMAIWSLAASLLSLASFNSGMVLDILQFASVIFIMMEMLFVANILEASAVTFHSNGRTELYPFYVRRAGISSTLLAAVASAFCIALVLSDTFFITAAAILGIGIRIWLAVMMKSMSQDWEQIGYVFEPDEKSN